MSDFNDGIIDGARTAFIDENFESSADLKPQLIFNNLGNKVLNSIKDELTQCDEFFISHLLREGIQMKKAELK